MRAESALKAVLPLGHPICRRWDALIGPPIADGGRLGSRVHRNRSDELTAKNTVLAARGILSAAHDLLKSGRLSSLSDSVRAETVVEVLDQAEQLVAVGAVVPAAVLAGGALETHLRHVCDRAGLLGALQGAGSIDKYKGLLDTDRKAGNEVITMGEGKEVAAWADDRNTAAHRPTAFKKPREALELMIVGIRQFVARTE